MRTILTISAGSRASKRMLEHVGEANSAIVRFCHAGPWPTAEFDRMQAYRNEMAGHVNIGNNTRRAGDMASVIVERAAMDIDHKRNGVPVTIDVCLGTILRYKRDADGLYVGTVHARSGKVLFRMVGVYRTFAELKTAAVGRAVPTS